MIDFIEIENQYYIRAQSSLVDDRTRVLLEGDTFAVFDRYGDVQPLGFGQQGVFHQETRHLSRLALRISKVRPLLLSSNVREDNIVLGIDLTNPDLETNDGWLPHGSLHIYRTKFLWQGACYEKITLHNYGLTSAAIDLSMEFGADFADIFEVRGHKREKRGSYLEAEMDELGVTLGYQGLDRVLRRTRIECSLPPAMIKESEISLPIQLGPQEEMAVAFTASFETGELKRMVPGYDDSFSQTVARIPRSFLSEVSIHTSNEQFNEWLSQSRADLRMMINETPFGLYPYAGVPWFSTIFGRDGIITALESLWMAPSLARGVLSYLASTQATSHDPERDSEPGKILHETRKGEMAELREIPFGRYYGSVDSTPLFVLLAGAYYERTCDQTFLRRLWPNILAALDWIDKFGDVDQDGFVEYARMANTGLVQQGWKDSNDSVFYKSGDLAEGPIALCEVQAYVYAAKLRIAEVAMDLGYRDRAEQLRRQAADLQTRFERAFWCAELSTYALALDGKKQQCRVRSSNAGQCLFSGIVSEERAQQTISTLLSPDMFSGWGVRTIAANEARYNPMSYHNGSVWPHDNALIAWGGARRRSKDLALRIMSGLLDLSRVIDLHRLPELICGFSRRTGKGPTLYPVACLPQAWAAGSVFLLLQACLGLEIRAKESRIYLHHTALPEALSRVEVRNIEIGEASVDLGFERRRETVAIDILRREGDVDIVALK